MIPFEIKPDNNITYCVQRKVDIKGKKISVHLYIHGETGAISKVQLDGKDYLPLPSDPSIFSLL